MAERPEFEYKSIPIGAIEVDLENLRQADDQAELEALCSSIEARGIEVMIVVREIAPGRYRGDRRTPSPLLCQEAWDTRSRMPGVH